MKPEQQEQQGHEEYSVPMVLTRSEFHWSWGQRLLSILFHHELLAIVAVTREYFVQAVPSPVQDALYY